MGIVWVGFLQLFLKTSPCGQSGDGSSADLLCSLTIYVNSQKNKDSFSCFWANGQKLKKDLRSFEWPCYTKYQKINI